MQTVIITGGTGLIGTALGKALSGKGYQVIILTRKPPGQPASGLTRFAYWDPEKQIIDKDAVSSADHIIHLAGAGVADKRWTKKRKQEIISSRIESSILIVDGLKSISNKVQTIVSASAIGWYGEDSLIPNPSPQSGEGGLLRKFIETDPPANDFLGTTCKQWEESIEPVNELGKRLVILRTGIVLSKSGGALKEFLKPVKWGIAPILGNGKHVVSWIHINDLVNMFMAAIENEKMKGVYNAVAPNPVSNKQLITGIARVRKKFYIPVYVPRFLLKMIMGEMSTEVLKSASVDSNKIRETGFQFQFPDIGTALAELMSNKDIKVH